MTLLAGLLALPLAGAEPFAGPLHRQEGETKLVASDGTPGDQLGLGVSIDGDTACLGAYADDPAGADSGSAYVFRRSGTSWHEEAKLVPADGEAGDEFGLRVSVSGDVAIVGCPHDGEAGFDTGSVYVFERVGSTWTQTAKWFGVEPGPGDQFGRWLVVDGARAVVSCHLDDHSGVADAGSAYVFRRAGSTWLREARLVAPTPGAGNWFARSVSLHGTTLVVGEPRDDTRGADAGRAHVFEHVDGTWRHRAELFAPEAEPGDQFGASVSADGGRVAVGAIRDDVGAALDAGSAYVFRRTATTPWALPAPPLPLVPPRPVPIGFRGSTWSFEARLTAFDAATGDQLGRSVALDDGLLLVGAIFDDHAAGADAGSAYAFELGGTTWTSAGKFVPADSAAGDLLGYTVALDGRTGCVGAYLDDNVRGVDAGCAYVFDVDALPAPTR